MQAVAKDKQTAWSEDMERMDQGIYTEGFFNLTEDNI